MYGIYKTGEISEMAKRLYKAYTEACCKFKRRKNRANSKKHGYRLLYY